MSWDPYFNIARLPIGSFRSIAGYAAESLVIGRAMQCGYNLFFKAWRDSAYDGVLDYSGVLFRVEIKGTKLKSLSVTAGGRAGAQINRAAGSREHVITKGDVDFLLGINSTNGECYVIPAEVLEIFARKTLSFSKLALFREKWKVFHQRKIKEEQLEVEDIRKGFSFKTTPQLRKILKSMGERFPSQKTYTVKWDGFRGGRMRRLSERNFLILMIWKTIYLKF